MAKSAEAFRTISEVAEWLEVQTHVLRFWESKFTQVKPVKRAGGRRYYRPNDMALIAGIRVLLHDDGVTIRGVQKILREKGVKHVVGLCDRPLVGMEDEGTPTGDAVETMTSEPASGKVIPMQPSGNVSNLFDSIDAQAPEEKEETEEPETLSLFSHRSEPNVETPPVEPEAATETPGEDSDEEAVPSFTHSTPEAAPNQDAPPSIAAEPEALAAAEPEPHPEPTEAPKPEAQPAVAVELPAASPISGPALAEMAAAAGRLSPEGLISQADRLAPAARRLQGLHARMTNQSG